MFLDKETFKNDYKRKLISLYRESVEDANDTLKYMALGSLIKDYMANDWHDTEVKYELVAPRGGQKFGILHIVLFTLHRSNSFDSACNRTPSDSGTHRARYIADRATSSLRAGTHPTHDADSSC